MYLVLQRALPALFGLPERVRLQLGGSGAKTQHRNAENTHKYKDIHKKTHTHTHQQAGALQRQARAEDLRAAVASLARLCVHASMCM